MIRVPPRLPDPSAPWVNPATGRPTQVFYEYVRALDQSIRELINAENTRSGQ